MTTSDHSHSYQVELELLCFITGVVYDVEEPEGAVKELITIVGEETQDKEDMGKVTNSLFSA